MTTTLLDPWEVLASVLSSQRRDGMPFDIAWPFGVKQAYGVAKRNYGKREADELMLAWRHTRAIWKWTYEHPKIEIDDIEEEPHGLHLAMLRVGDTYR